MDQEDFRDLYRESRSLQAQNCSYLHGLCRKLKPDTVIELGSGISTAVMSGVAKRIYTGDRTPVKWDSELPGVVKFTGESTEFFSSLAEKADLFFLDGRLAKEDFALIHGLSKPHTVYVLDDFEGIEKGVTNALGLIDNDRMLMQPVDGKYGRSTLAAMIPKQLIRLVNQ